MTARSVIEAARREVDALADRGGWSDEARAILHGIVTAGAEGTTGPREIAQRYQRIVRGFDRASRARLWQVVRRVANPGLRGQLDRVYRNER
jgi:hypothetical protein